MQVQVTLEGKGQCCKRCFTAKTDKKKCRCRCKGQHHGKAHKFEKTDPRWNGEIGKNCNLPIDCIHCDIVECPGRKNELDGPVHE